MNGTLSFYECRFSGGDTMREWGHSNPTLCKRFLALFDLTGSGDVNNFGCQQESHLSHQTQVYTFEPPGEISTT